MMIGLLRLRTAARLAPALARTLGSLPSHTIVPMPALVRAAALLRSCGEMRAPMQGLMVAMLLLFHVFGGALCRFCVEIGSRPPWRAGTSASGARPKATPSRQVTLFLRASMRSWRGAVG